MSTQAVTPQFDVNGARQAGYSDDEILQHLTQTRPFDVQGALKSGYNKQDIINHLSATPSPQRSKPSALDFSVAPHSEPASIGPAPEIGITHPANWLHAAEQDINYGGQQTWIGRLLKGMGAPGLNKGTAPGESLLSPAGMVTGALGAGGDLGDLAYSTRPTLDPNQVRKQSEQGLRAGNQLVRHVGQAAGPVLAVTQPEFLPLTLLGLGAQKGVEKTASALGANPEVSEAAGNLATLGLGAKYGKALVQGLSGGSSAATVPAVPKSTQAFASLLDPRGGKVNVVEAAQDVQPHIAAQLAKQGKTAADITGQNGAKVVIDAMDAAKNERADAIQNISQPFMKDKVDMRPIADSYRSMITDELRNNEPKLAKRIETEAAKFDRDGTLQEVNDFRVRMNKELDSYYNKGISQKIASDPETRAQEAAVKAARQVQYGAIGDKAGVDPAQVQQLMREEGNLIEARNQLDKKYNQTVADHAEAMAKTGREKLLGVAGKIPTKGGLAAQAVSNTLGMKPLDVLNTRLRTAFSEPAQYQPLTWQPNPNGVLQGPAGPTLPGQSIQNPGIKGLLNPAPTQLPPSMEPIENVGPISQPAAKGLPARIQKGQSGAGQMKRTYTTSSTFQRPPIQTVEPRSPEIIPPEPNPGVMEQGGHAGGGVTSVEELMRPGKNYVIGKNNQVTYHGKQFSPESTPSGSVHVTVLPDGTLRENQGSLTWPQINALEKAVGRKLGRRP